MHTISATELARNTREVLDLVVTQGITVAIERNQTKIAQIMPAQKTMTAAQALAGLNIPLMTPEQGRVWLDDSRDGLRDEMDDPWA